mgnify:CR=1 FL=1
MKEFTYTITDLLGVHARPAQEIIDVVKKFNSDVKVVFKGQEIDITDLTAFVELGIAHKDEIKVLVDGEDEEIVTRALKEAFEKYL